MGEVKLPHLAIKGGHAEVLGECGYRLMNLINSFSYTKM